MSNSLNENIEPDDGLDYIFGRMGAIYGSAFNRHWDGIDPNLVRQEWKGQLGSFLTHKPSLDYAIARLDGNFPPSAIKFREFCNSGPIHIDQPMIEFNPKPFIPMPDEIRQKLAQLRGKN